MAVRCFLKLDHRVSVGNMATTRVHKRDNLNNKIKFLDQYLQSITDGLDCARSIKSFTSFARDSKWGCRL